MDPTREGAGAEADLLVTCWGTRGSICVPGPDTVRFGGNTSCVAVESGDGLLVLDAGTGIRALGRHLASGPGSAPVDVDLFVTHFHWDHIQGLPFFEPLYHPTTTVRVHGPAENSGELRRLVLGTMESVHFPLSPTALAARMEFVPLGSGPWRKGELEVAWIPLRHPQGAVGYRVRRGGVVGVAYLPDNELEGGEYGLGEGWYESVVDFVAGANVLFHDAMYTDGEYETRVGWGHSTYRQAARLAEEAGVTALRFFHHAPGRTDAELAELAETAREERAGREPPLDVDAAAEGQAMRLPGP